MILNKQLPTSAENKEIERKTMETVIEPVLDSFAGNIEIAIYMATEIEDALTDICINNEKRINKRLNQLRAGKKH
jgi:hypothetical protein